ncbi:cubilin-like [Clytia hemisphaerica]|uniref:CUB domain-containing protein n=1 Tax=Clytia hemisphaerica TaxID=252671 RepID=A0A7M6DQD1_9CNID
MNEIQNGIALLVLLLNTIYFTDAVSLNVTLTNTTGEFQSPRYPEKFRANDTSIYNIKTQPGTFIRLRWKVFEVWDQAPDCDERVYVRIWMGCAKENFVTRFCTANDSNIIPPDVYSNDHCMKIEFYTFPDMPSWNGGRFVAEYKQFLLDHPLLDDHGTRECKDMDFSRNIFHSTNYPLPYGGKDRCKFWTNFEDFKNITAIKVLFTKIDTNTQYSGTGMCYWTDVNDHVQVKSVSRTGEESYYQTCGQKETPFSRTFENVRRMEYQMIKPIKSYSSSIGYMLSYFEIWNSKKAIATEDPFTINLTNSTGEFQSPRYPDNYLAQDRATYNIKTEPGTFISLTWKVFEVWDQAPECNERAFVRIWIGCEKDNFVTRFCTMNDSNIIPPTIYSNDHCMRVEFHAYREIPSWNNGRFVAEYKQFFLNQSLIPNHASVSCNEIGEYLSHGTVHSTNFPLPYYGQDRCQFTRHFENKNITAVKVLFTRIDTNAPVSGENMCHKTDKNDYVQIKSKSKSGKDTTYRYCDKYESSFSRIFEDVKEVLFVMYTPVKTNHSNVGYMMSFFPIWNPDKALMRESEKEKYPISATVSLTGSAGEFTSPRYPMKFRAKDKTTYDIKTQPGTFIRLSWKVFEVWDQAPDCNERLYIRIWMGCENKNIVTRFCTMNDSNIIPPTIYSNDHCMEIDFYTYPNMPSWNNGRFVAEYKQFFLNQSLIPNHASVSCNEIGKYLSHGTVHSTNFPLPYYGQDRCQFTRHFENKNIIAVNVLFTKIDTNTPVSGSRMCHKIEKNDYIQIETEERSGDENKYRYCNRQKWPFSRIFRNVDKILFVMQTPVNWDSGRIGYMISFFPIWNSEKAALIEAAKEEESGGLAGGYIALIVIGSFILLIILCCKRYWIRWKYRKAKFHCIMSCYKMKDSVTLQKEPETVSAAFDPPEYVPTESDTILQSDNIAPYQPPTYRNISTQEQILIPPKATTAPPSYFSYEQIPTAPPVTTPTIEQTPV